MKPTRRKKKKHFKIRWDRVFLTSIATIAAIAVASSCVSILKRRSQIKKAKEEKVVITTIEPNAKIESQAQTQAQKAPSLSAYQVIPKEEIEPELTLLHGNDISKHNGEVDLDGDFVIVKGTEGVGYTDPSFKTNIEKALENGQLCGIYHFARPDTNNPAEEAECFVEAVKPYLGKAILVLDWEVDEEIDNTLWASSWLWQVYQMTGVRPILYTSASVAQDYDWVGVAGRFDLWVAYYTDDGLATRIPYDLSKWRTVIWQYSTKDDTLDMNITSLTSAEWQDRCVASNDVVEGTDLVTAFKRVNFTVTE